MNDAATPSRPSGASLKTDDYARQAAADTLAQLGAIYLIIYIIFAPLKKIIHFNNLK